jgi:hypothetical protein
MVSDALRQQVLSGTPLERLAAVDELRNAGIEGLVMLAALAQDAGLATSIRVAAAQGISPSAPLALVDDVAASLLRADDPVLRYRGIRMAQDFGLVDRLPEVERLVDDPATFWDLDEEHRIGQVAREAIAMLRAWQEGRDRHHDRRVQLLGTSAHALGLTDSGFPHAVFGIVMEVGVGPGSFSLVCLGDGTVDLYLSDGGGTLDAGDFAAVRKAAKVFLAGAQHHICQAERVDTFPLPELDHVSFYFLTRDGVRRYDAVRADLENGSDPLAPLYAVGDALLGELLAVERELNERESCQ